MCVLLVFSSACVTRAKHVHDLERVQLELDASELELAKLREATGAEIAAKRAELANLEASLQLTREQARNRQSELTERLSASQSEIDTLQALRVKNEKRLAQYHELRKRLKKMITAGKIRVYQRRGRIIVALPSKVLFRSGKAKLSATGKRALQQVGAVLKDLTDRRFLVAGHTENVPIKQSKFIDNWQLSAERATNVTRFLTEQGVAGENLAAAGYGEFDPIRKNTSAANRARNRRIEIILMPNIDDLELAN